MVGAEQDLATLRYGFTACIATLVYSLLDVSGLSLSEETTGLLNLEEELPCLLGDGCGEGLDVV